MAYVCTDFSLIPPLTRIQVHIVCCVSAMLLCTVCTHYVLCFCILYAVVLCTACTHYVLCACILYAVVLCTACTHYVLCACILYAVVLCTACTHCVVCLHTVCYAAMYVLRVHRKDLSKCVLTEITLLIEDEELSVKVVAVEALVDIVPHVNEGGA